MRLPPLKEGETFRYEKKFVIRDLEYNDVEHFLRTSPLMLSEIYQRRRVNSIYFDTPTYHNYEEHLSGVSERMKIRIRWYGDTFGKAINPVLELKIRQHEQGRKIYFKLKSFQVGKRISMRTMTDIFREARLPPWLSEMLHGVVPVLITSYNRRYFMAKQWKCRVTLDDDLKYYDLLGKLSSAIAMDDDKPYILEMKFPVEEYAILCSHMGHLPFHMSAFSKYVTGMEQFLEN